MLVDRYTFKIDNSADSVTTLNIPISMNFQTVDTSDVVERKFIAQEIDNSINPIVDYEKVRYTPIHTGSTNSTIQNVSYNCFMIDETTGLYFNNANSSTTYAQIGFNNDDLRFRKNRFKKSYIELTFYNSDVLTDQIPLFRIIINPDIKLNEILSNSLLNPVSNKPLNFSLFNPLLSTKVFGNGFFIYYYKDSVDINLGKFIYMKINFKNAKNGTTTNLITTPNLLTVDELPYYTHTRYQLIRLNTGFFYQIDDTYNQTNGVNNVLYSSALNSYNINLYQQNVI